MGHLEAVREAEITTKEKTEEPRHREKLPYLLQDHKALMLEEEMRPQILTLWLVMKTRQVIQ